MLRLDSWYSKWNGVDWVSGDWIRVSGAAWRKVRINFQIAPDNFTLPHKFSSCYEHRFQRYSTCGKLDNFHDFLQFLDETESFGALYQLLHFAASSEAKNLGQVFFDVLGVSSIVIMGFELLEKKKYITLTNQKNYSNSRQLIFLHFKHGF